MEYSLKKGHAKLVFNSTEVKARQKIILDYGMKQNTEAIIGLYENVLSYRETSAFKKLLDFVVKFKDIAPYNAMLLHMQKPGSTYVATVKDWYYKFHRWPKLGARPLIILRPFGPVSFVYELADTEGAPVPSDILSPFVNPENEPITKERLDKLVAYLPKEGIKVEYKNLGINCGGSIQPIFENIVFLNVNNKKVGVKQRFAILLNSNHNLTTQYTTILHELGHLYCGHLQPDKRNKSNIMPAAKWLPPFRRLSRQQEEFEAETVNWLVCSRLKIQNNSERYLSGYLTDNKTIPEVNIEIILKAVKAIEDIISQRLRIPKELIVDLNKKEADNGI